MQTVERGEKMRNLPDSRLFYKSTKRSARPLSSLTREYYLKLNRIRWHTLRSILCTLLHFGGEKRLGRAWDVNEAAVAAVIAKYYSIVKRKWQLKYLSPSPRPDPISCSSLITWTKQKSTKIWIFSHPSPPAEAFALLSRLRELISARKISLDNSRNWSSRDDKMRWPSERVSVFWLKTRRFSFPEHNQSDPTALCVCDVIGLAKNYLLHISSFHVSRHAQFCYITLVSVSRDDGITLNKLLRPFSVLELKNFFFSSEQQRRQRGKPSTSHRFVWLCSGVVRCFFLRSSTCINTFRLELGYIMPHYVWKAENLCRARRAGSSLPRLIFCSAYIQSSC